MTDKRLDPAVAAYCFELTDVSQYTGNSHTCRLVLCLWQLKLIRVVIHTFPVSPLFWALMPVRTATLSACARGEPPPQGIVSRRLLAMAIDFVGGRRTSALSPCLSARISSTHQNPRNMRLSGAGHLVNGFDRTMQAAVPSVKVCVQTHVDNSSSGAPPPKKKVSMLRVHITTVPLYDTPWREAISSCLSPYI